MKPEVKQGVVLGRLTVLSEPFKKEDRRGVPRLFHVCRCTCGTERDFSRDSLKSGRSNSCGCLAKELTSVRSLKHGKRKSPIYAVWNMMLQRCNLPSYKHYADYGGRGVRVAERWHDFQAFYDDMGDPPFAGASLERKDNNGDYTPENVEWADRRSQNRNKRNNQLYEFQGKSQLLCDWADELGLNYRTLVSRIYLYGWSVEKAFTTPVK